ncbi:MAG: LD-carboxypeptidase [Lachnospiraceae bacterium]|nr:LD-carboxypeptidase [Lachnospiraceae bacterium]
MKYPRFLQNHGTIAFVAPSFGCASEPYKAGFLNAQKKWKQEGYQLKFGPNCYVEEGVGISNKPALCGEELTEYYCAPDSDCLISCGGGELMCEILDYVDFERIGRADPKWYMGYSDNTNMTFLLATLCDTASVYGPCAAAFGMEPRHQALEDALAVLRGEKLTLEGYDMWERESLKSEENPFAPYHLTEHSRIRYWLPDGGTNVESLRDKGKAPGPAYGQTKAKGTGDWTGGPGHMEEGKTAASVSDVQTEARVQIQMSGRLLGGCMDCLVNLLGTKYDKVSDFVEKYKGDGILWFLEACDLNLMGIRRAMWQMEHAGWFKNCSGFLIGRPLNGMGAEDFGIDHYQAVCEMLYQYQVPVLMDLDIGHLPPMMPLVCGSMAQVTSDGSRYTVEMKLE